MAVRMVCATHENERYKIVIEQIKNYVGQKKNIYTNWRQWSLHKRLLNNSNLFIKCRFSLPKRLTKRTVIYYSFADSLQSLQVAMARAKFCKCFLVFKK